MSLHPFCRQGKGSTKQMSELKGVKPRTVGYKQTPANLCFISIKQLFSAFSRATRSKGKRTVAWRVSKDPLFCRTLKEMRIVGSTFFSRSYDSSPAWNNGITAPLVFGGLKEKKEEIRQISLKITRKKPYCCEEESLCNPAVMGG